MISMAMAKLLTDNMLSLDIRDLARRGSLKPGNQVFVEWSRNGHRIGVTRLQVGESFITLNYRAQSTSSTEWQSIQQHARIVTTPCHYGGTRQWFACPDCGRRVAILYIGARAACRKCHDLVYRVQREHLAERYTRRLEKVRKRLGWPPGFLNGRWGQPSGMYLRTYFQLLLEHERQLAQVVKCESQHIGLSIR
jgi:hypothetical protein